MEALQPPLVPDLLFPHGDVGAVISNIGVLWGQSGAKDHEGRLLGTKVRFVSCARPLGGHAEDMRECASGKSAVGKRKGFSLVWHGSFGELELGCAFAGGDWRGKRNGGVRG